MRSPSILVWLAAALVAAAAAIAQDYRHERPGGARWPIEHGAPASWTHAGSPQVSSRPPPYQAWDPRHYNGYWSGGRWYYGAPQGPAHEQPGFRPGFIPWRRGAYLPPAFEGDVVANYWRYHLRRPPYGYQWIQVGDEFLLVSVSTGLIFDVVTAGY